MGLTVWEGPPILVGRAKLIAKLFSFASLVEPTEEDVDKFMLEQAAEGKACKVEETWVYCEDPEVIKETILDCFHKSQDDD